VKTPDKFRFSLQWGAETVEKIQAGDFLESLGNRKSEFIVIAVTEYLNMHPEALDTGRKPKVIIKPIYTREQVEAMIRSIMEEKMASSAHQLRKSGDMDEIPADDQDVDEMLKNLDLF